MEANDQRKGFFIRDLLQQTSASTMLSPAAPAAPAAHVSLSKSQSVQIKDPGNNICLDLSNNSKMKSVSTSQLKQSDIKSPMSKTFAEKSSKGTVNGTHIHENEQNKILNGAIESRPVLIQRPIPEHPRIIMTGAVTLPLGRDFCQNLATRYRQSAISMAQGFPCSAAECSDSWMKLGTDIGRNRGIFCGEPVFDFNKESLPVPVPLPFYVRMREPISCEGCIKSKKCRRSRTVFTELQLMGLEKRFETQKYLSTPDRMDLAENLGLSQIQVKTWYQNRRMKWKKQVMQSGGTEPPTKPKGRPRKITTAPNPTAESCATDDVTSTCG